MEQRLIDANYLLEQAWFCDLDHWSGKVVDEDIINETPTIDAEPVRHGQWVKAHGMMPPEYHHRKCCSLCGGWAPQDFFGRERMSPYCQSCGARMDLNE